MSEVSPGEQRAEMHYTTDTTASASCILGISRGEELSFLTSLRGQNAENLALSQKQLQAAYAVCSFVKILSIVRIALKIKHRASLVRPEGGACRGVMPSETQYQAGR